LCLLDPYGLDLEWSVISQAGAQKTIDLLLNFPLMDMNMNVLWQNPDSVKPEQAARMTRYWGDESWKLVAYSTEPGLFGDVQRKAPGKAIAKAFAERLMERGGFEYVAKPLPMRNSTNAIVYFLFFASNNATAHKIIRSIFKKYGAGGDV
jgi:three-Cys-motif partner protein